MRCLHIKGGFFTLSHLSHSKLQKLIINTSDLFSISDLVTNITQAQLPALQHLEINLGDLNNLLQNKNYPNLKHLGLLHADAIDTIIEPLAHSVLLLQLETLDVTLGDFSEEEVDFIIDNKDKFYHLKQLKIGQGHYTSLQHELDKTTV